MKALIHGVHFHNKGAELMLRAVNQQVQKWNSNNCCCLFFHDGKFQQRNKAEVNHLIRFKYQPRRVPYANEIANLLTSLTPKIFRQKLNIVLESEIDTIFDASGLAFSDKWGAKITESAAHNFTRWKKQGKKIILLPQAFGPFSDAQTKKNFAKIVEVADLIFARDQVSYKIANQFSTLENKIRIAPDFTNLLEGIEPEYIEKLSNRPCIIPNKRMLDKTSTQVSEKYMSFLLDGINYLSSKQLRPFILIHETFDASVARAIQKRLKYPIDIMKEENPIYLKGIISKCIFVIGSRFHGLVSSFSQGIPCIGTGWSHKYQMLFNDYKCPDLLIDLEQNDYFNKFDLLIEKKSRNQFSKIIRAESENQKIKSQQMWSEVYASV